MSNRSRRRKRAGAEEWTRAGVGGVRAASSGGEEVRLVIRYSRRNRNCSRTRGMDRKQL
jgi:hypothetical protein